MAKRIEVANVAKSFGQTCVLSDVSLSVQAGEFVSLVGPSGCGKSTLLRLIAGLEPMQSGRILIGEQDVGPLKPSERDIAMVFQNYALYPHMTVRENVSMPLVMSRMNALQRQPYFGALVPGRTRIAEGIAAEVDTLCASLQLDGLLDRKPGQLSGGQRQRVALARAMVRQPAAFLMDEPLSNLDAKLRVQIREELATMHRRLGATFLYVTHDQAEALTLSDRVAVMDSGKILQLDTPQTLYNAPASLQVARFIGTPSINELPIVVNEQRQCRLGERSLALAVESVDLPQELCFTIRAEHVSLTHGKPCADTAIALSAVVVRVEHHGSEWMYFLELNDVPGHVITSRVPTTEHRAQIADGAVIEIGLNLSDILVFGAGGQRAEVRLLSNSPHMVRSA